MVLKRNLEHEFIAYDAPTIPRARRSARKRITCKKTFNEGELCAFELLAVVAGKLLQESESSSASSSAAAGVDTRNNSKEFIKQEPHYNVDEGMRTEQEEQGSSEESVVSSAICLRKRTQNKPSKEVVDASIKQTSSFAKSACSGKEGSDLKPRIHRNGNKIDGDSAKYGESFDPIVDTGNAKHQELRCGTDILIGTTGKYSSKVSVESRGKPSPPTPLSKKADLGRCQGSVPDSTHVRLRNHVKMEGADDEEILSKWSNPISEKAYGSPTRTDNCETRNLLTSKYWKSAPKLKDCQPANSGSKRNNIDLSGKSCCEQERSQHNTPFKKRKLFGQTSVVTHEGGISCESVSNLTAKRVSNWSDSVTKHPAGNKISSSSGDCQRSLNNPHVKLSVKSFRVPELLIDVPDSASVGSLKKTVLDAITTVLGGGLHVGVLLHGKKIRDDSKTLLQTGISEDDNLNDLNFILEPSSPTELSLNSFNEDCPVLPFSPLRKDYVNRSINHKQEFSLLDKPMKTSTTTGLGRNCRDLVPFSAPDGENKLVSDSRALVPVPEDVPALAAVPINSRPRRAEIGQRRTRRPFSVSEVEALVQAVEKLGTGRWRDVKLCAFENAKHRTYVDLKDKWKTLVHTARISPQQRRGEPVPQQLLDRVLAAHAYWSHHQAKQHGKHLQHPGLLRLSDSPAH